MDGKTMVKQRSTLEVGIVPRTSDPAVSIRRVNWRRSYNPWGLRNRVNGGYARRYNQHGYAIGKLSVHTFHRLVPPDKYFDEHPGYFSLIDGERRWKRAQLCLSNPEVAGVAAKTAGKYLDRVGESHQDARYMIGVSQMDHRGNCECEDCRQIIKKAGAYSGLQLKFVNRVAELVEKDYPWATITTLAYRQSKEPPTADITGWDNVAIRFCTDFGASFNWPYHSFYDEKISQQRQFYRRWQEISDRMHLWVYPHQYRHQLAPMPNIRAVAENIRFFNERNAEEIYVQQSLGRDLGREPMRFWMYSKLMWNPRLDVKELMLDFIFGYFGEAASEVVQYHELLWNQLDKYTEFSKKRNWIYAIHDEDMYRHGFVEKARDILNRARAGAENETVRRRVDRLKVGVVYVETVQLFMQMRDGDTPPDTDRYIAVAKELGRLCDRLGIESVGFYDGSRTIHGTEEFLQEMKTVRQRRHAENFLPPEAWGEWTFRKDPENRGVQENWYKPDAGDRGKWVAVKVPAFLGDTKVGEFTGYGWYRTTFKLPEDHSGRPIDLQFDGVDEQAWVYVNGELVGEHNLESEFMQGQEVTVDDLWNRPFTITVPPKHVKAGKNLLVVRIHNSTKAAGIHQPVRIYLPPEDAG